MLIVSKFPGVCLTCNREVRIGDRVSWIKGRRGVDHAACSAEGREVAEKVATSRAVDVPAVLNFPVPDGLSYLGYQKAGIAYALAHVGTIIADEMGLGKTVQAIGVINASPDIKRVLIACPASLKLNWRNECTKWLTRPTLVNVWPKQHAVASAGELQIDVINYDILKKLPKDAAWDLLILDEAHYVKNPKAARSKLVKELRKRCTRVLSLTGTPILNRPIELWPLLQLTDPETWDPAGFVKGRDVAAGEGAGFFRFAKRYCNAHTVYHGRTSHWDFTGSSNLPELQERLRSSCMVRRLKADVLKELPPKRRQTIELEIEGYEDEDLDLGDMSDSWDEIPLRELNRRVQFTDISRVRRENAVRKVPAVVEHVTDAFESSGKIILFAHHREVIEALRDGLAQFNPVVIDGSTPIETRQANVTRFQTDDSCRLIIGSIGAMGVGLTLTASSHVIFAELDWTPANVTQAEDRAHRIGQLESVLVQHLVAKGSLDARMVELLIQKQEIADLALDEETLDDVSDRALVEVKAVSDEIMAEALKLVPEVHAKLRYLAARCDGAEHIDGAGFNKLDTGIGKRLAALPTLSPRQALLGQKIVQKYRRQLEGVAL